jgi:hypothetical protein
MLLAACLFLPSAGSSAAEATPSARVGAFYFDGWAGPLSSFHFGGLIGTEFSKRRPLYGWRDNTLESMRTQLSWARQDGISFFAFDWYYNPDPVNGPINMAHDNYLRLRDHNGVGFALNYVNQDGDLIPPDQWAATADRWVTEDFLNPDYVRIDGKPLLVILDEHGFNVQMGGAAGVNAAIATLQEAAKQHGLPGVFVVGGRYLDWTSEQCFPRCLDTDGDFPLEQFSHPYIRTRPFRVLTDALADASVGYSSSSRGEAANESSGPPGPSRWLCLVCTTASMGRPWWRRSARSARGARAREEARPLKRRHRGRRGDRAKHDDGDEEIHDGSNHVGLSNRCRARAASRSRTIGAMLATN